MWQHDTFCMSTSSILINKAHCDIGDCIQVCPNIISSNCFNSRCMEILQDRQPQNQIMGFLDSSTYFYMLAYLKSPHNNKTLQAVQFNYICMSAPRKKSTLWHEKIASIVLLNLSWLHIYKSSGVLAIRVLGSSIYKSSGLFLRPKFSITVYIYLHLHKLFSWNIFAFGQKYPVIFNCPLPLRFPIPFVLAVQTLQTVMYNTVSWPDSTVTVTLGRISTNTDWPF